MRLKYDAVDFILKRGDDYTKLHLLQFLNLLDTKMAKDLILTLLKSQMPSSGFPSRFDRQTEGIRETCRIALLLLKCGIPSHGLNIQCAVNFLLKHQREDGGWSENPELSIPEHMIELSNEKSVTWLTANVVELIREVGLGSNEACRKALSWLRETQNEDGGWMMFEGDGFKGSDPDSTAQILFMIREIYGENDPVYLKGKPFFEKHLDELAKDAERGYYTALNGGKRENDIYHLTHLLGSSLVDKNRRVEASYDLKDKRVKKIVKAILDSQREDSGWSPFWTEESSPVYTMLTLKLLVWVRALNRENLKNQLKRHLESSVTM